MSMQVEYRQAALPDLQAVALYSIYTASFMAASQI